MKKQTNKNVVKISTIMNRTWKLLLVVGLFGLCSELIFMIAKLAIVGNQVEGKYAIIWFASSMTCLIISGLIAVVLYGKQYIRQVWDWIFVK